MPPYRRQMDIVSAFGLRPIINAVGTATRVGGQRMHPEVIAAMADAAGRHFAIDELQEVAGREIAAATGAESGYVTAGASARLLLGTAACIAALDPDRIDRLPDTEGMPNEIIVQRGHRNAYDHALRTAGARIVGRARIGCSTKRARDGLRLVGPGHEKHGHSSTIQSR